MNKKFAFTLSEVLIMVAIVGILATISVVSLKNLRPDKDVLLVRKAYNETARAVSSLANDETIYPQVTAKIHDFKNFLASVERRYSALLLATGDTAPSANYTATPDPNANAKKDTDPNTNWGVQSTLTNISSGSVFANTDVASGVTRYTSSNKFAYNFAEQFDHRDRNCNNNVCTFVTTDNMYWQVTDNFNTNDKYAIVMVDINGTTKGANSSAPSGSKQPDRFNFKVDAGGGISVYGTDKAATRAKEILSKRDTK